jgi:hypothetical protein
MGGRIGRASREGVGVACGSQSLGRFLRGDRRLHVVMRARCAGRAPCFRTHGGHAHHSATAMLTEAIDPQRLPSLTAEQHDPGEDRIMLAIQYATAIIAAFAAGLLSLVH